LDLSPAERAAAQRERCTNAAACDPSVGPAADGTASGAAPTGSSGSTGLRLRWIPPARVVNTTPAVCSGLPGGGCYVVGGGTIGSAPSLAFANLNLLSVAGPASKVVVAGAKNPDTDRGLTQIVFERYPGYVWIMGTDGTNLRPLSPTTGGGWMEPRFAPDGTHVLTTHDLGGGHQEIFMLDTQGGAPRQLTNAPQYPWKWRPSLDPTGTKLIVTYGTDSNATSGPNSHIGLAPLPAAGQYATEFTPLTPIDVTRPSYDGEFSPDGSAIIFDAGGRIWIADADGGNPHSVSTGKLGRFNPLISGQILYIDDVSLNGTRTPLYAANADGTNARLVADGNFAESFCALIAG
jgi:hypothetical protein